MRAACVSSVLCTRVLVCQAQGSECEACEAKPGARHASSPFHPFYPRVKWLHLTFVPRVKNPPPRRSSLRVWSLLPVSLPNRCAVRNRAASVAACLRCSRHHRAVYRHGQKRTHSCAYISATTSHASGCKAICEAGVFTSRRRCRIIAKYICASSTCRVSCNIACNTSCISCNTH